VTANERAFFHIEQTGLIVHDTAIIWHDHAKHQPPCSCALLVVITPDEGERYLDFAVFSSNRSPLGGGWQWIGGEPLDQDETVTQWAHLPDLPPVP
jgi:hypothetical protein